MNLDEALRAALAQVADQQTALPGPEPLTPRESEVLELLALGLQNKEIAAQLTISERTSNCTSAPSWASWRLAIAPRPWPLLRSMAWSIYETNAA